MTIKTKRASSLGESNRRNLSLHKNFSEFLNCVRQFSVEERRAALNGPNAWMAEPLGPTRELNSAYGKELLKYIWDHLADFKTKGREAIQAHFVGGLGGEDNRGVIIANAVWSCMLEHSDDLESIDGRADDVEQTPQKKPSHYKKADNGIKPGRRPTAQRRKAIVRKHFKKKKDLDQGKSDGRLRLLLKELDDKNVSMPASEKFSGLKSYCEVCDAAQDDSSGHAELKYLDLVDLLKRDLYK